MDALEIVLLTALVSALGIGVFSLTHTRSETAPERAEHWVVRWLSRHRATRSLVTAVDRRIAGGAAVAFIFVALVVAATSVGWLFDSLDSDRGFARWDDAVAEWGAESSTTASTNFLATFTEAGATLVLAVILAAVGLFDKIRRGSWSGLAFLATVIIGIAVINNTLKVLVMRERPLVPHLVSASGYSFPSGHSATAAACWAAVALVLVSHVPRRFRWLLFTVSGVVTILVAASRALLGVHWLTDVMAGVIVGWTWFFVVAVVFGGRVIALGAPATDADIEAEHEVAAEPIRERGRR